MSTIKINEQDWAIAKLKLLRKYNHLSDADLDYKNGQEEELIDRLAKRLHRDRNYILFTLSKQLTDVKSNRL
ncbi:hypothetical protein ACL9RF_12925 [Sphingobacterium sp. Mn56C]|uniref:hypothetical protein n=1 Tax=Sphingobacterium sp. Mn56C TaxID=3395261 RepID=UPI003BDF73BB